MPTIDDLISKYRGGGQITAATTPRATQIAQSTSTPASQPGTIDDLIAKYRPTTPQSTGSTVHETTTPASSTKNSGISFQQRMAQAEYERKKQEGILVDDERTTAQNRHQSLVDELGQIEANSGYVTDEMTANAQAARRQAIVDELHSLDTQLGNAAQAYTQSDRVGSVFGGWAQLRGGNDLNALLTIGRAAGEAQARQQLNSTDQYLRDLMLGEDTRARAQEYEDAIHSDEYNAGWDKAYAVGDRWAEAGNQKLAYAKEGVNGAGRLAIDLGVGALDLAGDAVVNQLVPGAGQVAMATRVFGEAAREQRQKGGSLEQQLLAGTKAAAIEVLTEKIGGPFEKLYGKTLTGKMINTALDGIDNKVIRKAVDMAADAFGEAAEEMLSDIANPVADYLLGLDDELKSWKDVGQSYDIQEILYDGLVGGILGLAGSATQVIGQGGQITPEQAAQIKEQAAQSAVQAVERKVAEYRAIYENSNGSTAAANSILRDPAALQSYIDQYGELQGKSRAEQAREIAANLRGEDVVQTPVEPAQTARDRMADQGVPTVDRPRGPAGPTQNDANVQQANQMRDTVLDFLTNPDANPASAREIVDDPKLRAVYEALTGETLPDSRNKAKQQVLDRAKSDNPAPNEATADITSVLFGNEADQTGANAASFIRGLQSQNQPAQEQSIDDRAREIFETPFEDEFAGTQQNDWDHADDGQKYWAYLVANGVDVDSLEDASNRESRYMHELLDVVNHGGNLPPQAAAQAFAEAEKNGETNFSKIISRAYEIAGMEMPSGIRSQYAPTAQDLADRARQTATSASGMAQYYEQQARNAERKGDTEYAKRMRENAAREREKARQATKSIKDAQNGQRPVVEANTAEEFAARNFTTETPQNRAQTMDADEGISATPTTTERIVAQPQELNSRSTNTAAQQTTQTAENSAESGTSMPTRARADGETRERGFTRNVRTDENRAENLRKVLNQNRNTYRQISNKSTLAKAEEMFQNGDAEQTVLDALAKAEAGQKLPPEMVPLSKMVADYLTLIGDTQAASDITARMAVQMTEAGQFTQAAKILRGAPADTVMQTIQKALDRVNEDLKAKFGKRLKWKAELTDAEKALIKNADYKKAGEFERVYDTIAKRVGAEMPVTIGEKITEFRRMNMLLRARTHVRNLIANVPTVPMRIMKDRLSGAIQGAFTKAGLMKQEDRTRTAIISKDSKNLAREYYAANKGEIQNMGEKWDMNKSLREYKRYFKDGKVTKALSKLTGKELHNAMETVRRATYWALEKEDAPFVRWAYIDALAQICEVKGVTSAEDITQEMHEFALQNAEEATYKADTVTAQIINKLKQSGKVPGAIADIIFPFTNTPANILKMTLDYSPVGFLKTAGEAWSGASTATAIDSFSKATVGTAIIALGILLRAKGKITGDDDDDKNVAAFEKASGKSGRSAGGRFTYDWVQPVGSMIALGAGIWEALEGQDDVKSALIDAMYSAGDGILEMSLFQNITSILKGYGSPTENFSNAVINGLATQMVPGIVSDIAKIMDGTVRSTYTDGNVIDKSWAQMKAMIPGLSKTLPASVDVRGEAVSRGDIGARLINTLLNPGTWNSGQPNDVDKEIAAVYELTGTASVVPKVVEKSYEIKDVNYTLTPKEREQFQKTMGKSYYAELEKIIGEKGYDDLSGEEKAYLMTMARKKAANDAEEEFAKARGLDDDAITRSKWEDLDAGERTLYLVAKAEASSIFDKKGKVTSFEDLDALLEKNGPYSKLSDKAREVIGTGTGMSRLDDMYKARGLGIKSETYYDAWSKYKDLNEEYDKTAAAEELKTYINKMPGLSKLQKTWLTRNLNLYRVMPVETKTYDKFVGAGVKAESAETLAVSFRDINPVGDYKTVQNSQKYQAIASAKYLSDAEKWAAFFSLMNSNTEKCEEQARRAKDNGYTYDYWAANSEYAVVKQQKGK